MREGASQLSGVEEYFFGAAFHRSFEVGIVEQNIGRFATELLRDALDRRCRILCDQYPGARGSCERHHIDSGMFRQSRTNAGTVAIDQVEHPRGHTRRIHDLGEDCCVERRYLARLQHHRAAGREWVP
jgi:hypothetical protein